MLWPRICRIAAILLQIDVDLIDLRCGKAGDLNLDLLLVEKNAEFCQLCGQSLAVPAGLLRDLVVRESKSAL